MFTETEKVKQNKTENQSNPKNIMTEINNLPDKEFKALVIRMATELWKRID